MHYALFFLGTSKYNPVLSHFLPIAFFLIPSHNTTGVYCLFCLPGWLDPEFVDSVEVECQAWDSLHHHLWYFEHILNRDSFKGVAVHLQVNHLKLSQGNSQLQEDKRPKQISQSLKSLIWSCGTFSFDRDNDFLEGNGIGSGVLWPRSGH